MSAVQHPVQRCVCCGEVIQTHDPALLRCAECRRTADHLPPGYAIHRSLLDGRWYAMYGGWYPRRPDGTRLSFDTRVNAQMWCLWHANEARTAIAMITRVK